MAMTSSTPGTDLPVWVRVLLGFVLIAAGVVVLGDVALATLVSVFVIGWAAIVAGVFEIIHSFWTKGWGGFVWQIILGLLYIGAGIVLISQPVSGVLILTWLIGIFFLVSGGVRIIVGFGNMAESGWLLILSGVFGIIAGIIILSGWPASGIWVIGLLLGIDLIAHGVGWLALAWRPSERSMA
jgi:uncharacterized membrane protein HdeD (DUF308 family)